jgi:hypothetical protein
MMDSSAPLLTATLAEQVAAWSSSVDLNAVPGEEIGRAHV